MGAPKSLADPLSARSLVGYGLAAVPAQFQFVLILVMYLKFAVDDLGASASAIGAVFFVAKLWDAISDPLVGSLSDRTTSRFGRRRPWLYASAPLLAAFGVMAWAPPAALEGAALVAWLAFAVLGFYTAYTIFEVPHMALGAELTFDRQGRNHVFGVRQVMRTLGMLVAGTGGVYLVQQGVEATAWMAWGVGLLTLVLVVGGTLVVAPERAEFSGRGGDDPYQAARDVLANPHARLLLFVFFVESVAAGAIGALAPFVIEYVVKAPQLLPGIMAAYMGSALAAVPLWVRLGRRFEKRHLWLLAMVQGGIGYGLVFFVGEGTTWLMVFCAAAAGSAGACGNTLGQALKAEVIDYDEYRTGERKEGAYFAGWSFVAKLAAGVMIGVVGWSLDASGYVENAVEQSASAKETMLLLMGGLPMVGYAVAALAFSRFGLTEAEHARFRAELDAR